MSQCSLQLSRKRINVQSRRLAHAWVYLFPLLVLLHLNAPETDIARVPRGTADVVTYSDSPPDALRSDAQRKSIFSSHIDIFGEEGDAQTWSTERKAGHQSEGMKMILTSDLFDTAKGEVLKAVLRHMLGGRHNLTALWILDARAGWSHQKLAPVVLCDTLPELKGFQKCGISRQRGLWLNRWCTNGSSMRATSRMGWSLLPGGGFHPAAISDVKRMIDEADILYVPGGNPFTLLDNLRNTADGQVLKHIERRIKSGQLIYVGRSAGIIITGATTDVSADPRLPSSNLNGLNLLPGKPPLAYRPHYAASWAKVGVPHSQEWRQEHARSEWRQEDFLESVAENHPGIRGVRLRDGEFLVYSGGKLALMHN